VINIPGTHGKTTTTAMCALILIESGANPTVHLGAELADFRTTVRLGAPEQLLVSKPVNIRAAF
jgi:UDP-N-acetylmuramate--alanine ligase